MKYKVKGQIENWNGFLQLNYVKELEIVYQLTQQDAIAFSNTLRAEVIKHLDTLHYITGNSGHVAQFLIEKFKLKSCSIIDRHTGVGIELESD